MRSRKWIVLETAVLWVVPVVLAITLHEAAHGYVARIFGDQTAWMLGRVTLNPLKHIDPIGTVLVPGVLFLLQRAVPVRMGEAGAGEFRQPAPSEARHDLGRGRGSDGELRDGARLGVPRWGDRAVGSVDERRAVPDGGCGHHDQPRAAGAEPAADSAARRRAHRGGAAADIAPPTRWRAPSRTDSS